MEAKRSFIFARRCYGLGRITAKLNVTTSSSIELSILLINVARIMARPLHQFLAALFARYDQQDFLLFITQNRCVEISEKPQKTIIKKESPLGKIKRCIVMNI